MKPSTFYDIVADLAVGAERQKLKGQPSHETLDWLLEGLSDLLKHEVDGYGAD